MTDRLVRFALISALMLGVGLAFRDPLMGMVRQWNDSPMYSYAFTVPPISAFIAWQRRAEFRRRSARPARLAATLVLGSALVMLAVGEAAAIQVVQQLGFIVAIAGTVLLMFGWAHLAVAAPAIAYLLFMVPIWDVFTEPLHWPFQLNSARLGVAMLQAFGIPVYREDTILLLPNIVIEVARACSGVNYLVAVLALALPLAFIRLQRARHRAVLIASAMVIAALANSFRVALICVLAYYEVGSPLHGPFHVLHGLFVAGVGYVALFAGLQVLERREDSASGAPFSEPATTPRPWRTADLVIAVAVFWAIAVLPVLPHAAPVAPARPIGQLATRMGSWYPDPIAGALTAATEAWTGADHRFSRRFRTVDGQQATVDVWHFERQQQNHEVVNYRAAGLHRAASRRGILMTDGGTLPVNFVAWPEKNEFGVFWYDIAGAVEAHQYVAKAKSVWNVIRSRRNDAAVVMVRTTGTPDDPAAVAALENAAAELATALRPIWATSGALKSTP